MMAGGHNPSATRPSMLTLSAVDHGQDDSAAGTLRGAVPSGGGYVLPHVHDARLCAPCMAGRYRALNPTSRRPAIAAEAVAADIRRHGGSVWPAVIRFGISYRHACRIRAGWRPGGRRALAIPYTSRGWSNGERSGRWLEAELRLAWGDR